MRIWLIWIKRINVTYYNQYFTLNCLLSLKINTRNNKWCKWQISETINHVISSELQHIIRHRKIGYIVWKSAGCLSTYINIVCMIVSLLEYRYAINDSTYIYSPIYNIWYKHSYAKNVFISILHAWRNLQLSVVWHFLQVLYSNEDVDMFTIISFLNCCTNCIDFFAHIHFWQ